MRVVVLLCLLTSLSVGPSIAQQQSTAGRSKSQVRANIAPLGAAAADAVPVSYTLDVAIHPSEGVLDASGSVRVRVPVSARTVSFALHDAFVIRDLRVDGKRVRFATEPNAPTPVRPTSARITATLPLVHSDELTIGIEYGGRFHHLPQFGTPAAQKAGNFLDDAIEPRRVELASYSSWYPQFAEYGTAFAHDITLRLPAGWVVVGSGEKRDASRWVSSDALDIVCLASPDFTVHRAQSVTGGVEAYATRLPREFLERDVDEIRRALDSFTTILGPPRRPVPTVRSVFSPRAGGQGGYSRTPLIVTSEGMVVAAVEKNPRASLLQGVAHEVGHFWWALARGQADWINETFAEYFSYVAVERCISTEKFVAILAAARQSVAALPADAPSLATVPARNSESGYTIRYYKGSLMLHAFRQALGDDPFFDACRDFYRTFADEGVTTERAREFWRLRLGAKARLVDAWFDATGPQLPDAA